MSNASPALPNDVKKRVLELLNSYKKLPAIISAIGQAGGKTVLVGGAVRDAFLGLPIKDIDIEVHQLALDDLEQQLKQFGPVSEIGKVYGVLRIHGLDVDWSVPRTEGPGRKPQVGLGASSLKEAFERRDLTINAMGIDLQTFELIDPFHGLSDLQNRILRATHPARFVEDPLRFYRVLQFMSRFEMHPDPELTALCKQMDISNVSKERIEEEFKKLLLKSRHPSIGLRWLNDIGRVKEVLPELAACVGVDQGKKWHPEGDVFEHSMQALDAMARIIHAKKISEIFGDSFSTPEIELLGSLNLHEFTSQTRLLILMYGALCHDLGKPLVEQRREDEHVTFYGHAEAGVPAAKKMLHRIMNNQEIIEGGVKLVGHHMQPFQVVSPQASMAAVKRLANRLAPEVTLYDMALLVTADQQGRGLNGKPMTEPSEEAIALVRKALAAHVLSQVEKPIVQGRDLMDTVPPGPKMGRLLKEAYEIQINEGIRDKNELLRRILGTAHIS